MCKRFDPVLIMDQVELLLVKDGSGDCTGSTTWIFWSVTLDRNYSSEKNDTILIITPLPSLLPSLPLSL